MKARKTAEAEAHIENAEKALKTSFFKRKPDYHTASSEYFEAAQCYYVAEDLENAIKYYEESSQIDEKLEAYLSCGQKLEKCALVSLQKRDKGCEFVACDFYERASRFFLFANEMNHAAEVLTKAAKALEKFSPEKGIHYWIKACNLMVNFDRDDFAADTFKNTLNNLIKLGRLQSAIILLERMIQLFQKIHSEHNVYKCYLSIVVLSLAQGDLPLAKSYFNKQLQDSGFLRSDEIVPTEDVIKMYEDFNEEGLQELQQSQKFNYVEQQVNRVAKMLIIGQPVPIYKREADILIREAKGEEIEIPDDSGLLLPISTPKVTKPEKAAPKPKVTEKQSIPAPAPAPAPAPVPAPEVLEEIDLTGNTELPSEPQKEEEKKEEPHMTTTDYLQQIEQAGLDEEFDLC